MTAALCALLSEGGGGSGEGGEGGEGEAPRPQPLYMAAEINPRAAEACLRTAKANKVDVHFVLVVFSVFVGTM